MKKVLIKLTGLLVTSAIALSGNGVVLATEADGTDTGAETAVEETADDKKDGEAPAADETPVEDTKGDETPAPEGNTQAEDTSVKTEKPDKPDKNDTNPVKIDVSFNYVDKTNYDNNKLAEGYINSVLNKDNRKYAYNFDQELSGASLTAFTLLRASVSEIAAGRLSNTQLSYSSQNIIMSYTAQEIGYDDFSTADAQKAGINRWHADVSKVLKLILQSCPYEMYWCDKTSTGIDAEDAYVTYDNSQIVFVGLKINYRVALEYRVDESDFYTFDTTWGESVAKARDNADKIVEDYKNLNDYKKLEAYKNKICDLVDYNYPAVQTTTAYGNPWQMIWVFDGDEDTKVVCEGYSKAFQYLCDKSEFKDSSIYALSVYGNSVFGSNSGGHMWNVVHMGDGKNYLVDVTNCDHEDRSVLFLRGKAGNVSEGKGYLITVPGYTYSYTYEEGSLTPDISTTDYKYVPSPDPDPEPEPAQVKATSLSLNYKIGVRFKLELPDEFLNDSDAYVEVNGTRCEIESPENGVYPVTYYVAVPDVDKKLTLKLFKGNGNEYPLLDKAGEEVTETGFEYSASEYINNAESVNSTFPADTILVVKRLADYSKYSKKYFDRTDNLGNYSDVSGDVNNVQASDLVEYKTKITSELDAGIGRSATSLSLEAATEINHKFTLSSGKSINDFKFYVDGTLVTTSSTGNYRLWYDSSSQRYVLTIKGITATQLQKAYLVVVKDQNDNVVITIQNYSVLSYVYSILTKAENSAEYANEKAKLVALVKSMYLYNRAAMAKFNVTE